MSTIKSKIEDEAYLELQLPGEEKSTNLQLHNHEVEEEIANFLTQKDNLITEITKWDNSESQIVELSKQMCLYLMDMVNFTLGKGILCSTMELINTAQNISEIGHRLNILCRSVADTCPYSASKLDLLSYLERITFFSHQLNITSKVKADIQLKDGTNPDVELDNATSLVQAARNLLTSVIMTVKESHIASTKFRNSKHQSSTL